MPNGIIDKTKTLISSPEFIRSVVGGAVGGTFGYLSADPDSKKNQLFKMLLGAGLGGGAAYALPIAPNVTKNFITDGKKLRLLNSKEMHDFKINYRKKYDKTFDKEGQDSIVSPSKLNKQFQEYSELGLPNLTIPRNMVSAAGALAMSDLKTPKQYFIMDQARVRLGNKERKAIYDEWKGTKELYNKLSDKIYGNLKTKNPKLANVYTQKLGSKWFNPSKLKGGNLTKYLQKIKKISPKDFSRYVQKLKHLNPKAFKNLGKTLLSPNKTTQLQGTGIRKSLSRIGGYKNLLKVFKGLKNMAISNNVLGALEGFPSAGLRPFEQKVDVDYKNPLDWFLGENAKKGAFNLGQNYFYGED